MLVTSWDQRSKMSGGSEDTSLSGSKAASEDKDILIHSNPADQIVLEFCRLLVENAMNLGKEEEEIASLLVIIAKTMGSDSDWLFKLLMQLNGATPSLLYILLEEKTHLSLSPQQIIELLVRSADENMEELICNMDGALENVLDVFDKKTLHEVIHQHTPIHSSA